MRAHRVVLAVQDTTTLNYSTQLATEGLGPIAIARSAGRAWWCMTPSPLAPRAWRSACSMRRCGPATPRRSPEGAAQAAAH